MWEKVTGKHRVSGDAMVAIRDITLVEAGVNGDQKPTMVGSFLFSNDADESALCLTVHTSDVRRRTVAFKFNSTGDRDRVMQELQQVVDYVVASTPALSSRTIGAAEGDILMMRKFQDELRAGICIRKPRAKYLSCDPLCTQLEWRDPPIGGRGWLKRTSSNQGIGDKKNVIALASILEITPTESTSPLRSFIGSPQHHRISIVSSVRTLTISTEASQDHLRVYHGLQLLLRHSRAVESTS
ncbi:hypothetical protein DYB32_007739 [Aphanomyces invadans]|uniref:Uncharacterized protein n=1 Tax=Aphanomyces invadans TaxID=157072 RepID=A0A3R6VHQ7_9STRA|nr:hypothetical protein DYB32_007739 [Aphanomyces invadans]